MYRVSGVLLLALLLPTSLPAQVYRCQDAGTVMFADRPCGNNAEPVIVPDNRIGGRFSDNLPPPGEPTGVIDEPAAAPVPESESACRFIDSTRLRTYTIRNQVVKGMTRDQVIRAFGPPPESYTSPREVWIYQSRYYGKLYELTYVYFRGGCVDSVEYRKP